MGQHRDRVVNVLFHGVGTPRRSLEPDEERYWVDTARFQRLLDELAGRPDVRISFDDGNVSDADIALPALEQRGLPATFFVIAGRLGTRGRLREDDVRELHRRGMQIGNHGMSHRPWPGMDPASRRAELVEARASLAAVCGAPVDLAACPLGRYDRRVLADLRRLGYVRVFTSDRRPVRSDAWLQARYSIRADETPASLRAEVLSRPGPGARARLAAFGLVKRLR